jgi:hypothetical protein
MRIIIGGVLVEVLICCHLTFLISLYFEYGDHLDFFFAVFF